MSEYARTWQAFIRANADTLADVRTIASVTTVGPLTLEPSTVVRYEPNLDELMPPGMTQWLQSSPIGVLGQVEPGDGGSHDPGVHARLQMWRLCSLLAVAWEQPWWPLHPPQFEFLPLLPGSHLTHVNDVKAMRGYAPPTDRSELPGGSRLSADPWWNDAWEQLTTEPELDGIARTYASALRTFRRGPLEAEAALLGFVAILDAAGKRLGATGNSNRVRVAMAASYRRHSCPDLRANANQAGDELHRLAYERRCEVTHEAAALSLIGHRPGPLGDKPNDLDPGLAPPFNTEVLQALAKQSRLAIKGLLGCPEPETGTCIHTR